MTVLSRFDLSNLALHEIAELGARVRGCGDPGATFDAIARSIVDAIWGAFEDRVPPVLALVRLYRIGSDMQLAAEHALDGASNDARRALVARFVRETADGMRVELVTDADQLAAESELVLRYGVKAALVAVAPVAGDDRFALAIYSRVAIARGLADAFDSFAYDVALALARASDCRADRGAIAAARTGDLERLLDMRETTLSRYAGTLVREADAHRRRADELDRRLAKDEQAATERLQRTQRAMLNVIEDLREARADLEHRVEARTAELESANRAKDDFLAMLGHELRNPLAPILTALELMQLRGADALLRERAIIERQTRHLAKLVDDLLDVARIARGVVKLDRRHVRIADVIAKAVETATPLFEQYRHELVMDVPRELAIDGDPDRIAQVFANLLTNAAKYTDPGGRVTVTARADGDEVEVRVTDNGRGVPAELLPRVFELFVQGPQSVDRSRGGLGLGLAIARNVVQLHRGRIEVSSAGLGCGSTFTVHLPRVAPDAMEDAAPAAADEAREPGVGSVLVVDDNEDAAAVLCAALATRGYTTHVAHDPAEALRIATALVPDVAILDIGLPGMDGYELARHLRELPPWKTVRMLALSGYGQNVDRQRSRQAGFDHHLVKPIDLATLERCLRDPPS
ncbi:MAG TPA: ATP-binding protein [Kofleriaceae bacterium]